MIYLDHAATSFPKPAPVLAAVQHWFAELGVSADRGDGPQCAEVAAGVARARAGLAALCGVPTPRVAFTSGATESLNLFLRAFLRPGMRVLTTALEHSSLVRPLVALRGELRLELEVLAVDAQHGLDPRAAQRALRKSRFDLFAFSHASNVLGCVLPAAELCDAARACGCTSLLDASQTAGLLPVSVGADAVVASAHKGLLAPPGLGFLAVRDGVELRSVKQGGTGTSYALDRHPTTWPTAFEAGTANTPAILGLAAAIDWLASDRGNWHDDGLALVDRARAGLSRCARLLGASNGVRVPILSFVPHRLDPAEAGALLGDAGIHVRSGFQCAPWLHAAVGSEVGGVVRVSPGPFSRPDDIDALLEVLAR